jgi:hypothetical protein
VSPVNYPEEFLTVEFSYPLYLCLLKNGEEVSYTQIIMDIILVLHLNSHFFGK